MKQEVSDNVINPNFPLSPVHRLIAIVKCRLNQNLEVRLPSRTPPCLSTAAPPWAHSRDRTKAQTNVRHDRKIEHTGPGL